MSRRTYKGGKFASSSVLETAITLFNNSGNFYAKKLLFYFTSGQSVNEHRHLSDNPDFNQDFPEYEDDWPSATFAEREDIEPNFFHREEEPFKYNLKELHKENIEVFSFLVGKHSELLGDHVFDLQDESHISKIISHLPFAKSKSTIICIHTISSLQLYYMFKDSWRMSA